MTSVDPATPPPVSGSPPAATPDPALAILERIAASLDALNRHLTEPPTPRLLLRLEDLEDATGLDRRTIQRERSAGRFPPPSVQLAKTPLWAPEVLRAWIESGGRVSSASATTARRA